MRNKIQHSSAWFLLLAMSFSACQHDVLEGGVSADTDNVIHVGVEASGLTVSSSIAPIESPVTRAIEGETKPAEQISWLVQPLKQGLDITYGKVVTKDGESSQEKVAILKLSDQSGEGITLIGDAGNQYATNTASGFAVYTFRYRDDNTNAKWYDNGPHYFKGVHVPNRIRYTSLPSEMESDRQNYNDVASVAKVTNLTTDQSGDVETGSDNDLSNYYLLSHYLGMPANTHISATVSRILLPFRHRLAHVLAYIIIDPSLDTDIDGYENINASDDTKPFRDNPANSNIRFCNVDVLNGVKDEYNSTTQLHTLTPTWAEKVRKVTPHFYEEAAELVVYESPKKKIYPKSEGYEGENGVHAKYTNAYNDAKNDGKSDAAAAAAAKTACGGYEKKVYNAVPVYDLIVRPTYTSYDNVMYDEEGYDDPTTREAIADKKNRIDFQVGLKNGLNYEKQFIFDLDANFETVVYLHISREGVDYNASGSVMWQETTSSDDYYGLDNANGHTLSKAGSSWQRAFFCDYHISGDKVTDGGFYDENTSGEDGTKGQYLTENTWKEYFAQAYKEGAHHGDYFVLAKDITIDARSLPDDFVFTGHLDGFDPINKQYHTITLTGAGKEWKEYVKTTDYVSAGKLYSEIPAEKYSNVEGTEYTLPTVQLYTKTTHPAVYYTEDELTTVGEVSYVKFSLVYHEAVAAVLYAAEDLVTIGEVSYDKETVEKYYDSETGTYTYSLYPEPTSGQNKPANVDEVKVPAIEAYYSLHENPGDGENVEATTETEKEPAWDEYTAATPSIAEIMSNTDYYTRSGETEPYTYNIYSKPEALYRMVQHTSGSALFAGLNGIYSTKQEANSSITDWEANVHKEGNFWIPYMDVGDGKTNTGWRAEVMNLTVVGGSLFKEDAVVTGNVENCKDANGKVEDHTPAMPKYK